MTEQMMEIIDEVAWELSELARKVTVVHYMPSALKEELRSYSARLYSVYNENQSNLGPGIINGN